MAGHPALHDIYQFPYQDDVASENTTLGWPHGSKRLTHLRHSMLSWFMNNGASRHSADAIINGMPQKMMHPGGEVCLGQTSACSSA